LEARQAPATDTAQSSSRSCRPLFFIMQPKRILKCRTAIPPQRPRLHAPRVKTRAELATVEFGPSRRFDIEPHRRYSSEQTKIFLKARQAKDSAFLIMPRASKSEYSIRSRWHFFGYFFVTLTPQALGFPYSVKRPLVRPSQGVMIKTSVYHRLYHSEIRGNVEVVRREKRMTTNVKNFRAGVFTL
jgi:hypothetical protein